LRHECPTAFEAVGIGLLEFFTSLSATTASTAQPEHKAQRVLHRNIEKVPGITSLPSAALLNDTNCLSFHLDPKSVFAGSQETEPLKRADEIRRGRRGCPLPEM
jgi:hypothetical protein